MGAVGTFRFLEFTLRPAGAIATDRLLAAQWTKADPHHAGQVEPEFWIEQGPDRDSYLLLDEEGPLFFWKGILTPDLRMEMHIQFCPLPGNLAGRLRLRKRIKAGLISGLTWLMQMLQQAEQVREVYFDSESEPLIAFAIKHLRFVKDGQRLRKQLSRTTDQVTS